MGLYQRRKARVVGSPPEFIQEGLVRIDSVNCGAKLVREGEGLTARAAAGVDDQVEAIPRQAAKDLQRVGIAARPELLHAGEEYVNRIVSGHGETGSAPPVRAEPEARATRLR